MKILITKLSGQVVTVQWIWPALHDLRIISVKDVNGEEVILQEYEKQIIYDDIIESIS